MKPRLLVLGISATAVLSLWFLLPRSVGLAPIPRDRAPAPEPAWGLDGTCFTRYILDLETGNSKPAPGGLPGDHAAVSPDGKLVLFNTPAWAFSRGEETGDRTQLRRTLLLMEHVYKKDGKPVYRGPESYGLPRWSRDGKRFTFMSDRGGAWLAYSAAADGSDVKPIGSRPSLEPTPIRLSDNGQALYFQITRTFSHPMYEEKPFITWERKVGSLILTKGGVDTVLCRDAIIGGYDISPDGTKVAYDLQTRDLGQIIVQNLASGEKLGLFPSDFRPGWAELFGDVEWRPDGKELACTFSRRYWIHTPGLYFNNVAQEHLGVVSFENGRAKTRVYHVAKGVDHYFHALRWVSPDELKRLTRGGR